jgi:hypothetical protein
MVLWYEMHESHIECVESCENVIFIRYEGIMKKLFLNTAVEQSNINWNCYLWNLINMTFSHDSTHSMWDSCISYHKTIFLELQCEKTLSHNVTKNLPKNISCKSLKNIGTCVFFIKLLSLEVNNFFNRDHFHVVYNIWWRHNEETIFKHCCGAK